MIAISSFNTQYRDNIDSALIKKGKISYFVPLAFLCTGLADCLDIHVYMLYSIRNFSVNCSYTVQPFQLMLSVESVTSLSDKTECWPGYSLEVCISGLEEIYKFVFCT